MSSGLAGVSAVPCFSVCLWRVTVWGRPTPLGSAGQCSCLPCAQTTFLDAISPDSLLFQVVNQSVSVNVPFFSLSYSKTLEDRLKLEAKHGTLNVSDTTVGSKQLTFTLKRVRCFLMLFLIHTGKPWVCVWLLDHILKLLPLRKNCSLPQ